MMVGSLFGFAYSKAALAFLEGLPVKLRKQIVGKVAALANDQHPPGSKMIRGMKDDEEKVYRIRSGDYRVLYAVRERPKHVVILDIDHRKDVYR